MKLNLSIGIVAYNEEESIKGLLNCILNQKSKYYNLEKIYVISDASNDETVIRVREVKSKKITLIIGKHRRGKPTRENWLFNYVNSKLLITLDADTYIADKNFIDEMIKGYILNNSLFVSANPTPIQGKTMLEKTINNYYEARNYFRKAYDYSKTQYGYQGLALLYEKSFYKNLHIPSNLVNDDTYIYFMAKKMKIKTVQRKNALIYFRSPDNFTDYVHQMDRYMRGANQLNSYFDKNFIDNYQIKSLKLKLYLILYQFIKNPIGFIYLKFAFIYVMSMNRLKNNPAMNINWTIIDSTKSNLTL